MTSLVLEYTIVWSVQINISVSSGTTYLVCIELGNLSRVALLFQFLSYLKITIFQDQIPIHVGEIIHCVRMFLFGFLPFESSRMKVAYVSVQSNYDILPSIDPSGMYVTLGLGQRTNTGHALFRIHAFEKKMIYVIEKSHYNFAKVQRKILETNDDE